MSLTININLPDDRIDDQTLLDTHLRHIGFSRFTTGFRSGDTVLTKTTSPAGAQNTDEAASVGDQILASQEGNPAPAATRERGKPAPGRARRTKEEIAEDEAADKADIVKAIKKEGYVEAGKDGEWSRFEKPSISTGESRVGPDDDAETEAQDRADEAAEEGKTVEAEPEKTLQDLIMEGKSYIGTYASKFGMAEVQEDGAKIFNSALGAPKGDGWRWGTLADANDYAGVAKAVAAWKAAAEADKRFGA